MDPMVTQMQVPPFLHDVWVIFVYVNHIYVAQHPCIHANALVFWFAWTFLTKYLLNSHQFLTHMVTQIQVPPFLRDNRVIFMYMSHKILKTTMYSHKYTGMLICMEFSKTSCNGSWTGLCISLKLMQLQPDWSPEGLDHNCSPVFFWSGPVQSAVFLRS